MSVIFQMHIEGFFHLLKQIDEVKQSHACRSLIFFIDSDNILLLLFAEIYRQRKRSKSKVKLQDRKSETEDDQHLLTASTTSKTASVLGLSKEVLGTGGTSNASQESD